MRLLSVAVSVVVLAMASPDARAEARRIHGQVYVDRDRDGRPSAGEPGVAGAVVALGVEAFVVTDAGGQFELVVTPTSGGIAWVRVPDGFEPGPVWAPIRADTDELDLGVRPREATATTHFVIAADTHIAIDQPFSHDLRDALTDALAPLDPAPAFVAILGDITQGNQDGEFDLVDAAVDGIAVPYVPVPGNHDWYDAGDAWFRHYGPDNYSFDLAGVHFVVWNMAMPDEQIRDYLGRELAHVSADMPVVALTHGPPTPATIPVLRELGVDYVLTGHVHANHVVDHGGVIELGTEPFLMGGLDFTPAGYRVIAIDGARLVARHAPLVDRASVARARPETGHVVSSPIVAGDVFVVAVTDLAGGGAGGIAAFDRTSLARRWFVPTPVPVRGAPAAFGDDAIVFAISDGTVVLVERATGRERWRTSIGGPMLAPPLVDDGEILVAQRHAIAAITRAGDVAWSFDPMPHDAFDFVATGGLATGGGLVIGATARALAGLVALERATGKLAWRLEGEVATAVNAAPIIVGDTAYFTNGSADVVAVALDSGELRWQTRLDPQGFEWGNAIGASPAYADGVLVVATLYDALVGLDAASGRELWRRRAARPSPLRTTHYRGRGEAGWLGAPVIAKGVVYAVDTAGGVVGLDLLGGAEVMQHDLGAPVLAGAIVSDERIIVATFDGDLHALPLHAKPSEIRTAKPRGCCSGGDASAAALVVVFRRRRRPRAQPW